MAEIGKLTRRKRMKSNLVSSGTIRSSRTELLSMAADSNRHGLWSLPAHPVGDDQPRQGERGEHRRDDADAKRHRETLYRTGSDGEKHGGRNEGGDVRIQDRRKRAGEA